jgi:hypothetical protein
MRRRCAEDDGCVAFVRRPDSVPTVDRYVGAMFRGGKDKRLCSVEKHSRFCGADGDFNGTTTVLHSFMGSSYGDGYAPNAGLIQATDGNFYGTALQGGTDNSGTVFACHFGL